MYRSATLAIIIAAGLGIAAGAQGVQHSELSIQVTGVFTKSTNSLAGTVATAPTTHLAKNSAGLLVGYRLYLNHWEALEVEYSYTRNGQSYITPATAPNTPALNYSITANMQEAVANEVITTPRIGGIFQPFILAGGGALIFSPRANFTGLVLRNQVRGAANVGAGVDFHIFDLGARAEYQGLFFKVPDFKNSALAVNKWTYVSQPSVGLILTW